VQFFPSATRVSLTPKAFELKRARSRALRRNLTAARRGDVSGAKPLA
jgi:hypothetical protein